MSKKREGEVGPRAAPRPPPAYPPRAAPPPPPSAPSWDTLCAMASWTSTHGHGARRSAFRARNRLRPVRIRAGLLLAGLAIAVALAVAACGGTGPSASGPSPAATSAAASPGPAATSAAASSPAATLAAASPGLPGSAGTSAAPSGASSPAASQDPSAVLAAIASQTEAIRGLAPRAPIVPRFIDEAGMTKLLTADLDSQQTAQQVADAETLFRGLGLFAGDRSLRDVYVEMLRSQVLGFYRQADKTLYVVERSGGVGPAESAIERYTFSHELTHALQDQHFGFDRLGLDKAGQAGQGDRTLARQALVEGDASFASTLWSQRNLTLADLLAIVKVASDPAQQKLLADLPPILRETMTFPYQDGLSFVMGLWTAGGWDAVNAAYAAPPESTEQILHPAKYTAGEKPVPVALPAGLAQGLGPGWSLSMHDTLGEMQLRVLLQTANDGATAKAAASDWGGDRVGLYRGPDGAWAIVLATAWDTPAAAARFRPAAEKVAAGLPHARVVDGAQGPALVVGSDAAVLDEVATLSL